MKYKKFKSVSDLITAKRWSSDTCASALDSSRNYSGSDMSAYIVIVGRNRDSDILTNCNFDVALERLGGESTDNDDNSPVMIGHFGHWACGWYELILVHETALDKLKIACGILNDLERYPVLDDDEFSQREWDDAEETIESNKSEFRRELLKYSGFKNTDLAGGTKHAAELDYIVSRVFHKEQGDCGEGWVTTKSIRRYFDGEGQWDINQMAREGSMLARVFINTGIVARLESKAAV